MPGKVTTSYGKVATVNGMLTPYLYGSGYGKDEELSQWADKAANLLALHFGLHVEKRGNSDGKSAGAHYDGVYSVGLGAWRHDDGYITFDASFGARFRDCNRILEEVPNRGGFRLSKADRDYLKGIPREKGEVRTATVYSPMFDTLTRAFEWLSSWGQKYCPAIRPQSGPSTRKGGGL